MDEVHQVSEENLRGLLKMSKIRIEVTQLPPTSSSPNWRGHWSKRYQESRIYHDAVYYSCVEVRNRALIGERLPLALLPFTRAKVNLTFFFTQSRRRDRDNLIARFKPGIDAIVDSGLVLDDDAEHLEIGQVDIVVDADQAPLTVIDIERLEENSGK